MVLSTYSLVTGYIKKKTLCMWLTKGNVFEIVYPYHRQQRTKLSEITLRYGKKENLKQMASSKSTREAGHTTSLQRVKKN